MEELVNLVVSKTGIPAEQAQQAVQLVLDQLKKKMPGPLAAQLDTYLANPNMQSGADVIKGLGGFFNK